MTRRMEQDAQRYFAKIDKLGGMIAAIDAGFFRQEIADAAFAYQKAVDEKQKIIVGVNEYCEGDEKQLDVLEIDPTVEAEQVSSLRDLKQQRDEQKVRSALAELQRAAEGSENVFPSLLEAARARVTVGEAMDAMAEVFGRYQPGPAW